MEIALLVIFVCVLWILLILIGVRTAKRKNRSPHWMWFGLHPILGIFVCITLFLLPALKSCPNCSRKITKDAKICPFCKTDYSPESIVPRKEKSKKQKIIIIAAIVLGIIVIFMVLACLLFLAINSVFINSTPYKDAMQKLQNNESITRIIGENIQRGKGIITGSFSIKGDTGNAFFFFKIKGDKGSGKIHVKSVKENGVWKFTQLLFYTNENDSQYIDLLSNGK